MKIEITPKIAAWLQTAMADGRHLSETQAIESLIDSDIDEETGLPRFALRRAIEEGIASGVLSGDLRYATTELFAAARQRHSAS